MARRWARALACIVLLVGVLPAHASRDNRHKVPCDGNFHLVRRFTKGRKTGVQDPVYATDKLWLLQGFVDENGDWRQALKIWDGSTWATEDVPSPQQGEYFIRGLDVTPDGVAWLAGSHQTDVTRPVILRWDGSRWDETAVPDLGDNADVLDIDMLSSQDGWAVGRYEADQGDRTLTMRWNGQAWERIESPGGGYANELRAVSIAAADDVWVIDVGSRRRAFHWDGVVWSSHPLPDPAEGVLIPTDVDAVRENKAWISGFKESRHTDGVVLSWDGERWSRRLSTNTTGATFLQSVDAAPGGWAVGENRSQAGVSPVVLRKIRGRWRAAAAENPGRGGHLDAVVDADGTAWATGRASSKTKGLYGMLQKACTS